MTTRTKTRENPSLSLAVLALGLALTLTSNPGHADSPAGFPTGSPDETESFRADLARYMEGMEQLPIGTYRAVYEGQVSMTTTREGIEQLSRDDLDSLRSMLDRVPFWKSLPSTLATTAQPGATHATPESTRESLSRFVADLRQRAGRPELDSHLAGIEARIQGLDDTQVEVLREALAERAPLWLDQLQGLDRLRPASAEAITFESPCNFSACSDKSFPNDVLCGIEEVFTCVSEIPDTLNQIRNDVISFVVTELFELLTAADFLPTPAELLAELGIDDAAWFLDLPLLNVPALSPVCPDVGTEIAGLDGAVGTRRAEYDCKRSIEFVAHAFHESTPGDVLSTPIKLISAAIFWPTNYLCLCLEAAVEIEYDDAQAAHRALLEQKLVTEDTLDVSVSTRVSQTSMDGIQSTVVLAASDVSDLGSEVGVAQVQINGLDATADTLLDHQAEQSAFLLDFQDLAVRLRIEEALTFSGGDRISLFQLPATVGGFLERVREIVTETVDNRELAGENVSRAEGDLFLGDEDFAAGAFKQAFGHYRDAYQAVSH